MACQAGRVAVRGADSSLAGLESGLVAPETLVFEDDVITLDGQRVVPRTHYHYLVLNKPRFVTTTVRDPDGRTDLGPWLREMPPGVFPVGRLDRETSGALLFTDDGDFSNTILLPEHHTEKLYWLWLDELLSDDDPRLAALVSGVRLDGSSEPLYATSALLYHRTLDTTELHVTLDEGKNRHIRKMCNILRLRLLQLHRKAIGTLTIEDLPTGQWRSLNADEIQSLRSSGGGPSRMLETKIAALRETASKARQGGAPLGRLESWLQELRPRAE